MPHMEHSEFNSSLKGHEYEMILEAYIILKSMTIYPKSEPNYKSP